MVKTSIVHFITPILENGAYGGLTLPDYGVLK